MLVLDKPKVTGDPPELPPFLKKRGGPERRVLIIPDISLIEHQTEIIDHHNNWKTTVYMWMDRITGEGIFDPNVKWETAHSSSRTYRAWLETYHYPSGIPPHIQFGGCIKASDVPDPTFQKRWEEWAKGYFF